jgi:hypothetical protein
MDEGQMNGQQLSGNLIRAILQYGEYHNANREILGGWSTHEHKMCLKMVELGILEQVEKFMTQPRYRFTETGLQVLESLKNRT